MLLHRLFGVISKLFGANKTRCFLKFKTVKGFLWLTPQELQTDHLQSAYRITHCLIFQTYKDLRTNKRLTFLRQFSLTCDTSHRRVEASIKVTDLWFRVHTFRIIDDLCSLGKTYKTVNSLIALLAKEKKNKHSHSTSFLIE